MSDFIDHLLAQVRPDASTALAPRAPSRFEPAQLGGDEPVAAPEPALAAPIAAAVAEPATRRRAKPPRSERLEVREAEAALRPVPPEARAAPLPAEEPRPSRQPLPAEPAPEPLVPHAADAPRSEAQPASELRPREVQIQLPGEVAAVEPGEIVRETLVRETVREIVPAEAAAEVPPREIAEALVPAAAPPPLAAIPPVQPQLPPVLAAPISPAPPAPVVEVRIGRIEIHAAQLAGPAVEAAPAPAAAGPSRLDRYLARG